MDHTVIFHIDGPVLVANPENLNQVSGLGLGLPYDGNGMEWRRKSRDLLVWGSATAQPEDTAFHHFTETQAAKSSLHTNDRGTRPLLLPPSLLKPPRLTVPAPNAQLRLHTCPVISKGAPVSISP